MSQTPNLKLTKWDVNDYFNDAELRDNWDKVDRHNHADKGGAKIPDGALDVNSVGTGQIKDRSITNDKLADASIGSSKLQSDLSFALQNAQNVLSKSTSFSGDVSGLSNQLKIGAGVIKNDNMAAKSIDTNDSTKSYLGIGVDKLNLPTVSNTEISATNKIVDVAGFSSAFTNSGLLPTKSGSAISSVSNKIVDNSSLSAIVISELGGLSGSAASPQILSWTGSTPPTLPSVSTIGYEVYYPALQDGSVMWRLRWGGSNWVFVGGAPINLTQSTSVTGKTSGGASLVAKDNDGTRNYSFWPNAGTKTGTVRTITGAVALNNIELPLAGTYRASYSLSFDCTVGESSTGGKGIVSTSIGMGGSALTSVSTTNLFTSPIGRSGAYTIYDDGLNAPSTASMPNFQFDMTDSTNKFVRQLVTISSSNVSVTTEDVKIGSTTVTTDCVRGYFTLYDRTLTIHPVSLNNWS